MVAIDVHPVDLDRVRIYGPGALGPAVVDVIVVRGSTGHPDRPHPQAPVRGRSYSPGSVGPVVFHADREVVLERVEGERGAYLSVSPYRVDLSAERIEPRVRSMDDRAVRAPFVVLDGRGDAHLVPWCLDRDLLLRRDHAAGEVTDRPHVSDSHLADGLLHVRDRRRSRGRGGSRRQYVDGQGASGRHLADDVRLTDEKPCALVFRDRQVKGPEQLVESVVAALADHVVHVDAYLVEQRGRCPRSRACRDGAVDGQG